MRAADRVRRQAELLITTLSEEEAEAMTTHSASSFSELIVDGYALVLELDVERLRLEREIVRLADSGDPQMAGELRELSTVLRGVRRTSEGLRVCLEGSRARSEHTQAATED